MSLNPFDLPGPEFLLFYFALSASVVSMLWLWLRFLETGGREGDDPSVVRYVSQDPYQIACLRGGHEEVLRTALVALLERGLLKRSSNGDLETVSPGESILHARRPLDKAILSKFSRGGSPRALFTDGIALSEARLIAKPLEAAKLLVDPGAVEMRSAALLLSGAGLLMIAAIKICVAISRGHFNILFLILLTALALVAIALLPRRTRTISGDRALAGVARLYEGLRQRSAALRMDGESGSLAFLAATFGVSALPLNAGMPSLSELAPLPPQKAYGHSGSGSSCSSGSSCGSASSCGGGGGGCGGGGCGGCGG